MIPRRAMEDDEGSSPAPPFPRTAAPQEDCHDEVVAISGRRTLYLVNIFLASSANFLNSFAAVCEDKLADVHRRISRLDSSLRILEAKLSSLSKSGDDGGKEGGFSSPSPPIRHPVHPDPSSSNQRAQ